jgi:hypothetical protein
MFCVVALAVAETEGIDKAKTEGMSCVWTPGASRLARAESEGISCIYTKGIEKAETKWIETGDTETEDIERAKTEGMSCVWTPGASRLAKALDLAISSPRSAECRGTFLT